MADRKYEVRGTDELGDVWTFATDDRERAENMLAEMQSDLGSVRLTETSGARIPEPSFGADEEGDVVPPLDGPDDDPAAWVHR